MLTVSQLTLSFERFPMKRLVLPLLILALLATSADAGLFSRLRARRTGGCACGVVCPCKSNRPKSLDGSPASRCYANSQGVRVCPVK
jgi:hypothetical protein